MINYFFYIYDYIVNVFKSLTNSEKHSSNNMIDYTNNNNNKDDLFKLLNDDEKTTINNYKKKITNLETLLECDKDQLYTRLNKLNTNFNKDMNIKIIIHSLEEKKNVIYRKNKYNIENNINTELSIEIIQFNSEIMDLLEKFKIIEKINIIETELQLYLDSIVIK